MLLRLMILGMLSGGLLFAGCIQYPNCKTDKNCESFDEFCVSGKCVKCRQDSHCNKKSPCKYCEPKTNTCEIKSSCCVSDADCASGKCRLKPGQRAGTCATKCASNDQCGPGEECSGGVCLTKSLNPGKKPCKLDTDCPGDTKCRAGFCDTINGDQICKTETVLFDFDEFKISTSSRQVLDRNILCLKKRKGAVIVEGHADQRGTPEYNIALSQRRANAVLNYLVNSGLDGKRLKAVSFGKEKLVCGEATDSCYQKNRRVELRFK